MAVVRGFIYTEPGSNRPARVVEPEMDMNRLRPQQSSAVSRLRELMRWLLPGAHNTVRPPMRSVARELEEAWPSSEC